MSSASNIGDPGGRQPEEVGSPALRVLCVEDNEGDFVLVREYLRDADLRSGLEFFVARAKSLGDAVSQLGSTDEEGPGYDLVLLDLSLPDSQGLETLDRVTEAAGTVPVIILSGNEDRELAVEMVQHGAQDFIPKQSLSSDLLARAILYAKERQRAQMELRALNARLRDTAEELKELQVTLSQAEKLDSLGRLAAGVAHEVKNPLATLQMGIDFFLRNGDVLGEDGVAMAKFMEEAVSRADGIIHGMVDYSRSESLNLELRDINSVIQKALRLVGHEVVKHSAKVDMRLTEPIPSVRIDEGKLEQVLINILVNAIQAMGENESDRILRVETFWGEIEEVRRDFGLRDFDRLRVKDHAVVIEIRDHGPGIPEEKLSRIFDPFYSTKPTGEGTGLGMSVAKSIIDLHRGHISVHNVSGPRGLRVRVFLRAYRTAEEAKAAEEEDEEDEEAGGEFLPDSLLPATGTS